MALLRRALVALGLAAVVRGRAAAARLGRHPAPAGRLARARARVTSAQCECSSSGRARSGARAVRQLVESDEVREVVVVDADPVRQAAVAESSGRKARRGERRGRRRTSCSSPARAARTRRWRTHHVGEGRPVVSTSDSIEDVRALLDLDAEARARGVAVVVGAAFSPGLLVRARPPRGSASFDSVDRGARRAERHRRSRLRPPAPRALTGQALDWRDGGWQRRPAGSGRELCWFPDPIGAEDCYRAELPGRAAARAGLPGRRAGHRPPGGHPPRPPVRPPPDAAQAPPGGSRGRRPRRGAGRARRRAPTRSCSVRSTARRWRPGPRRRWRCAGRSPAGCPSAPAGWRRVDDPVAFLAELVERRASRRRCSRAAA